MSKYFENNFIIDELGRSVLSDEYLLEKINGAYLGEFTQTVCNLCVCPNNGCPNWGPQCPDSNQLCSCSHDKFCNSPC